MSDEFVDDIIAATEAEKGSEESTEIIEDEVAEFGEVAESNESAESVEPKEDKDSEFIQESNEVESLAMKLGWKPDHESDNFVDAETYILRSREIQDSMRDHNKELKSQLHDLQGSVDALKAHNDHVYQVEVNKLKSQLDKLNTEKRAAVETADVDKVTQLDDQIESIKQSLNSPRQESQRTTNNPVFDTWVKDNQWYLTDQDMASYADQVAQQYAGAPAERIFNLVRNRVAEVWPEKFEVTKPVESSPQTKLEQVGKPQKGQATKPIAPVSPVEGTTHNGAKPGFTEADLSGEQKSIMNQFVRQGIMTKEQYISDIAKLQEA